MWREQALLLLNTNEIDTDQTKIDVDNEVGGWSNNRQSFWFYVNFRTLLGDLYNNYDTYNLSYVNCFSRVVDATGSATQVNIYVSGLDFVNSGYNTNAQTNTTNCVLRNHFINPNAFQTTLTSGERDQFAVSFKRPINSVRLQFELRSITNAESLFTSGNNKYPYFLLLFSIKPAVKPHVYKHNLKFVPARLTLSTPQISTNASDPIVSNEIGSWGYESANGTARQVFSFNVNMKTLLGNWWDKYDTYYLSIVGMSSLPVTNLGGGSPMVMYLSGLNFRNSYLQPGKTGAGRVPIFIQLLTAGNYNTNFGDKNERKLTFKKGEANVKLMFELFDMATLQRTEPITAGVPLPNFFFQMLVFPLI
jgi:hypothetical protein